MPPMSGQRRDDKLAPAVSDRIGLIRREAVRSLCSQEIRTGVEARSPGKIRRTAMAYIRTPLSWPSFAYLLFG